MLRRTEVPGVPGVLTPAQVRQTAESIAATQESSGALPWFVGGHTDPWDHVENAMALSVVGSPAYVVGAAEVVAGQFATLRHLEGAFRGDGGIDYHAFPQTVAHGIERFFRTLKEQVVHGRTDQTIDGVRDAVRAFAARYNADWLIAKNGYLSPAAARPAWNQPDLKFAA